MKDYGRTFNQKELVEMLESGLVVVTHNASETATVESMYGNAHLVVGAQTISLPVSVVGYNATFMATGADIFSLDLENGADVFILNGTALVAGNKITSDGTLRAKVYVECVVAGYYDVTVIRGLFIDGGA